MPVQTRSATKRAQEASRQQEILKQQEEERHQEEERRQKEEKLKEQQLLEEARELQREKFKQHRDSVQKKQQIETAKAEAEKQMVDNAENKFNELKTFSYKGIVLPVNPSSARIYVEENQHLKDNLTYNIIARLNLLFKFYDEPMFMLNQQSPARIREMKIELLIEIYNYSLCVLLLRPMTRNPNSCNKFKQTVISKTIEHRKEAIENVYVPIEMKEKFFNYMDYVDGFLEGLC